MDRQLILATLWFVVGAQMGLHVECPDTAATVTLWFRQRPRLWIELQTQSCEDAYQSIPGDDTLRLRFDVAKFLDHDVQPWASRTYRFTASNSAGESNPSVEAQLTFPGGVTVLPK